MSVFGNDFRGGYEEIMAYSPSYYRDVLEMEAVYQASGRMLEGMAAGLESAVSNRFVETMDAETAGRMERFLYIPQVSGRPLESRRKAILSVLMGSGKLSAGRLKEIIGAFTDAPVEITFPDTRLLINIDMGEGGSSYMGDIVRAFRARLPAHLAYILSGSYGGGGSHHITAGSGFRVTSHFYPRNNIPPLALDGSWWLDDIYRLTGYKGGSFLDFYPAEWLLGMGAAFRNRLDAVAGISLGVLTAIEYSAGYRITGSVYPWGRADPCYPAFLMYQFDVKPGWVTGTEYNISGDALISHITGSQVSIASNTAARALIGSAANVTAGTAADTSYSASGVLSMSAAEIMRPDAGLTVSAVVGCSQAAAVSGTATAGTQVNIGTGAGIFVEYHMWHMDGGCILDGSRALDADAYELEVV